MRKCGKVRACLCLPRWGEDRHARTTAGQNTPQNTAGRRAIKKERREKRAPHKLSTSERAATLLERGERGKKRQKTEKNFPTSDSRRTREAIRSSAEAAKKGQDNEKKKHRAKRNSARPVFFRCPKKSGKALEFNVAVMNTEIIISFAPCFVF